MPEQCRSVAAIIRTGEIALLLTELVVLAIGIVRYRPSRPTGADENLMLASLLLALLDRLH
ncbi:hypothetical protein DSUL_100230 [Desulfovibrionales bacterium]